LPDPAEFAVALFLAYLDKMRAYIQTDKAGDYYNVNAFVAAEGFSLLGWETKKFFSLDDISDPDPEILIAGGIGNVCGRLIQLGIQQSHSELDYPPQLAKYLGRKVWASTVDETLSNPDSWGIFIKPRDETKKFTGRVISAYRDFIDLTDPDKPIAIWCSEPIQFLTEWRCFIRYNEVLDVRQYKGAWDSKLDLGIVRAAVNDFKDAPAAYALDFGIDEQGTMKLVEVNDGHSLGSYGMDSVRYAKFLSARWAQLTGTKDYADF
jgi:hypothetical protein